MYQYVITYRTIFNQLKKSAAFLLLWNNEEELES